MVALCVGECGDGVESCFDGFGVGSLSVVGDAFADGEGSESLLLVGGEPEGEGLEVGVGLGGVAVRRRCGRVCPCGEDASAAMTAALAASGRPNVVRWPCGTRWLRACRRSGARPARRPWDCVSGAIEVVHGGFDAVLEDVDGGLSGAVFGVGEELAFVGWGVGEEVLGDVVGVVGGLAVDDGSSDADADAWEVELSDDACDVAHAVLSGVGAAGSDAEASGREVKFVDDEDEVLGLGAVPVE